MKRFLVAFFVVIFGNLFMQAAAQSKPFVPLEFEFPDAVLNTPKTYVYKNSLTGALRYKDVSLERKGIEVLVNWKEYDNSPVVDSCTEINGKAIDHYMIVERQTIKANVSEDSVYQDGSRLGEKVQTFYFNLNENLTLFASVRSFFLKDTSIQWQGKAVPCIVVQSYNSQKLLYSLVPDKPKEINGIVYYYFGKDVGLLMYRSEMENEKMTWQLIEIKERKT